MAIGEFTKQLAQQALGNPVKDMLESLRPPDLSKISETLLSSPKPAPPAAGENIASIMLGQIQAMQKALKEDEELVVLAAAGAEVLRVLEIFLPAWSVAVLTGIDPGRNVTRVIATPENLQLTCKVMKVQAPAKPTSVRVVAPRLKSD